MAMEETAAPAPSVEAIVAKAVESVDGERARATKASESEKTVENGEFGVAKVENGDMEVAWEESGEKEVANAGKPVADAHVAEEVLSAKVEAIPSFKAESNFISDLKEPERKALYDLKQRIDAAVKGNEFALPTVEVRVEKVAKTEIVVPAPVSVAETKAVDATESKPAEHTSSPLPSEGVVEKDVLQPAASSTKTTAPKVTPAPQTSVTKETLATQLSITENTTDPREGPLSETGTTPTPTAVPKPEAAVTETIPAPVAVASVGDASVNEAVPVAEAEVAKGFVAKSLGPAAIESTEAQEETLKEVPDCPLTAPVTSVAVEAEPVPAIESKEAVVATVEVAKETVLELKDDAPAEDISLWGVPLLGSKCDERTDVILLKFLRARDFKVNDAFLMLRNTIWWRRTFKADTILEEDIGSELDSYFYMHGTDKQGHPVCYNVYGAFQDKEIYQQTFGDAAKIDRFLRWRIQVVERGIQQLSFKPDGPSSILQITDLRSVPVFKKELRSVTSNILNILQDNYPELVEKNVFLNMPWYFSALYSFVSPILTQRTKSKFVVARAGQVPAYLFKYIAHKNVPAQYGGLARPDDTDFSEMDASVKELTLKAGEKETIVIPLESAGTTVVWDFSVNGGDIIYGVQFTPSATESYDSIIEKTRKIEEPVRNTYKSTEAGKLVLTADNSSRKKKLVIYRYNVKTPGVVGQG